MEIKEYLKEKGISQKAFADTLRYSEINMSRIVNGLQMARIGTAIEIEKITEGKVTAKEVLMIPQNLHPVTHEQMIENMISEHKERHAKKGS